MRMGIALGVALGACSGGIDAGDAALDAGPPSADLGFETRCVRADGSPIDPIEGVCTATGVARTSVAGDASQRVACTVTQHDGERAVDFFVGGTADDGTPIGLTLQNAIVASAGGAPLAGACQLTWTDGIQFGGACGADATSPVQPCQVSSIAFADDAAGTTRVDVSAVCFEAPSMPAETPARLASLDATRVTIENCPLMIRPTPSR